MPSAFTSRSRPFILALPLTRPSQTTPLTKNVFTYYQFQLSLKKKGVERSVGKDEKVKYERGEGEGRSQAMMRYAQDKAAETWSKWGRAEGGWRLAVYRRGQAINARIDFEELALSGLDPSLGPSAMHPDIAGKEAERKAEELKLEKIALLYPQSVLSASGVMDQLSALVAHRTPRHRRGFYLWLGISPLTAPFAIIPVIPNIPFFFCLWRAWSHYRAYRASQYLQKLLAIGAIVPETLPALDEIYSNLLTQSTSESKLLLDQHDEKKPLEDLVKTFHLSGHAQADISRAIEQARRRITTADT